MGGEESKRKEKREGATQECLLPIVPYTLSLSLERENYIDPGSKAAINERNMNRGNICVLPPPPLHQWGDFHSIS
eukprot:scaffold6338_cov152-Skeletonema_menzelii.AAC.9